MLAVIVTFLYIIRSLISLLLILLDFFPKRRFSMRSKTEGQYEHLSQQATYIIIFLQKKQTQLLICNYAKLEGKAGSCLTICHITGLSINYQRSIGNNLRQKPNFWLILQSTLYSL